MKNQSTGPGGARRLPRAAKKRGGSRAAGGATVVTREPELRLPSQALPLGQAGGGNGSLEMAQACAKRRDRHRRDRHRQRRRRHGSRECTARSRDCATCDADGGCISLRAPSENANCAVVSAVSYCEFELFKDVSTTVTCGQTVTVGTANCGACGSVAVEVFYDGSHCWQGMPDCTGKFVYPHAPLP